MKYKAVIADVDGTLIPPGAVPAPYPSARLQKAVAKAKEKGVIFSLASARSLGWVQEIISGLKLTGPIILDNGARIYDCGKKEYLWESFLPKTTAEKILNILSEDKSLPLFIQNESQRLNLDDLAKIKKWKIIKIIILHITSQKAEKLYQRLRVFPTIHVTKSVSGVNPPLETIHVTNFDATKQVAVEKFAKILNFRTKEIIGIGDSYNDFPLLMACGLKIAMGNATADIKEIADYIAPSYEEDGVAEVIERFILQKHILHNLSGEQKDQLLIITDKKGNKIGVATREECHKGEGKTHLAFVAFIIDSKERVLLTKRSKTKSLWGGYWDATVVSHVLPEETIEETAKRRGKEELGIEAEFKSIGAFYYFAKYGEDSENEYCHVLIGRTEKQVYPNPVEIEEIKKISLEGLLKDIKNNPDVYTPWIKIALEKVNIKGCV